MEEMKVVMNSMERAVHFVDIVSKYDENMDLVRGRYEIDAKSILGIISVDLTTVLTLRIYASKERFHVICNELKEYAV
jgi:phosphotransferase system HPr-like phosphotransfer protein